MPRSCLLLAALAALLSCQRLPVESTTSGSSQSGTSGVDEGGTFLDEGGVGGDEPIFDCDPTDQSSCPAEEKCTPVDGGSAQNHYKCVDADGLLEPFDPCQPAPNTGSDGCPAGTVCLADEEGSGVCLPLCLKDGDCTRALCIEHPENEVPYCADECSPFDSPCPGVTQCRREEDRFVCKFPLPGDVGATLAPCDTIQDLGCGTGFVCLPGAVVPDCPLPACCTSVCDLEGVDPCPGLASCGELFSNGAAPGFETIGACYLPA